MSENSVPIGAEFSPGKNGEITKKRETTGKTIRGAESDSEFLPLASFRLSIGKTGESGLFHKNGTAAFAGLYDGTAMPPELRKAHQANDCAVL